MGNGSKNTITIKFMMSNEMSLSPSNNTQIKDSLNINNTMTG